MSNPNTQQNTLLFTFASALDTLAYSVQAVGDKKICLIIMKLDVTSFKS